MRKPTKKCGYRYFVLCLDVSSIFRLIFMQSSCNQRQGLSSPSRRNNSCMAVDEGDEQVMGPMFKFLTMLLIFLLPCWYVVHTSRSHGCISFVDKGNQISRIYFWVLSFLCKPCQIVESHWRFGFCARYFDVDLSLAEWDISEVFYFQAELWIR